MILQPDSHCVERIIADALAEDIGQGDITSSLLVPEQAMAELAFVAREPLVVCGLEMAQRVFMSLSDNMEFHMAVKEGAHLEADAKLMLVHGKARMILAAERVALNLLQRMSGVATLTARYADAVRGTRARILDTRKTMPGLRELDKYAVRVGGGLNHRMRLDEMVLIKDNHIALCGGIAGALRRARAGTALPVEVECDSLAQVQEALEAGADRIMLDNMDISSIRQAVERCGGRVLLEVSGGVTLENIRAIAQTGVDFISVGRITHSAPAVDIGLDCIMRG